jgi:hypothetical protein
MHHTLGPQSHSSGPTPSPSINGISGTSLNAQQPADRTYTTVSRRLAHRNADSASTTSSGISHSHTVVEPVQQPQTTVPVDPAPALSVLTHGLPPNMTPPSPIAEFVRPRAPRTDTPVPGSPTADQVASLHRRSGSGGSSAPRAALGAHTASSPRRVASAELMRSLPPVPGITQQSPRGSLEQNRSSPSRRQRPILHRLATIASVAEHRQQNDFAPERVVQSANTTPETPISRRQWWRVGISRSSPPRPESRIMQYAPINQPRHAATAPVQGRPKEKDGGIRCIVM